MMIALGMLVLIPIANVSIEKMEKHNAEQRLAAYEASLYPSRRHKMGDVYHYPKYKPTTPTQSKRIKLS